VRTNIHHHRGSRAPSAVLARLTQRLRGFRRIRKLEGTGNFVWTAVAATLVLAGALATVLGARAVARSDVDKARLAFHLASSEAASTLRLAIQHEEDLVVSASAFITGNPHASPADFDRWAESVHAMQRYPELQNIGLVAYVPALNLSAFQRHLAVEPVRPLGPRSVAPHEGPGVLPPGQRSYYCLAVAGLARSALTYIPANLDYCSLAPTMIGNRDSGLVNYAPVINGGSTTLGVETPVYRNGVTPATVAARRRLFVGWLGELLVPTVVLSRALQGHPDLAATFRYDSRYSHVAFTIGRAPAHAQSATINLQVGRDAGLRDPSEGWTVQSFGTALKGGLLENWNSLILLIGGTLLSAMLGLLVLVLGTGRRRALSLVHEKTRELSHQALHDTLTGLPNRALVLDRAQQLLARSARAPGVLAGALFIDIDGFKRVNDNLGHAAGDQLLKIVGERLRSTVREQDTVGRLGGDEFVVLFECSSEQPTPDHLADRVAEALREPVELMDGRKIFSVTASIGVAVGQHASPDALLRDADLALYSAKAAGKDRYALFEASMYEGVTGRLELEADMSSALQDGQFLLLYQPIFELSGREVVGVEALIRWQHPTRGVLSPDSFIPLAEESGLIVAIGRWVLYEACRQAAAWAAAGRAIGVAVNVSAHQLGRRDFADDVRGALNAAQIEPSSLTLEITETALMRDVSAACEHLEAIKTVGVRVAIDDFGTGYASLSNLQRVPVDVLKIDKTFVAGMNDGGRSRELVRAVLGVGQALSLAVIAEGIEEECQVVALGKLGCAMAQGYLLAMPEHADRIALLLAAGGPRRSVGSPAA
jgi:diguanylate cyclase (GGDEF)-like protein